MTTSLDADAKLQAATHAGDVEVIETIGEDEGEVSIEKSISCAFEAVNKDNSESSDVKQDESHFNGNELPREESTAAYAEDRDAYQEGELDGSGDARKKSLVDLAVIFPQKLISILSNVEYSDIISWLPHGNGFVIRDKKRFADEVLPKHFKQAKFTSFTRKLNRWNFTRVTRGPEVGAYYHPLFQRDNIERADQMTCIGSRSSQQVQALDPVALGIGFGSNLPYGPTGMDQAAVPAPTIKLAKWHEQQHRLFVQQQQQQQQAIMAQMMMAQQQPTSGGVVNAQTDVDSVTGPQASHLASLATKDSSLSPALQQQTPSGMQIATMNYFPQQQQQFFPAVMTQRQEQQLSVQNETAVAPDLIEGPNDGSLKTDNDPLKSTNTEMEATTASDPTIGMGSFDIGM